MGAPITIQSNIKSNTKSFDKFGYFLGGIDVTHQNLDQFTPYIRGVSRIFLHKPPAFMLERFPDLTRRFKTYLETGFTSVDGISDISVDFTDFEGGFAGQRFSTVSLARDETENITIQLYELTGSPVRESLDTWITGTRDPRSGIAHYHGLIAEKGADYYSEKNHTAEMIYVNLDPTAMNIEYAAMFAHMFPTRVPKAHLNYEKGNRDNALLDIEMRCSKYESPAINNIGAWYIANSNVNYNYLDFDPAVFEKGKGFNSGYTYDYGSSGEMHTM